MTERFEVVELKTDEELAEAYEVMNELRTDVDRDEYVQLLKEMRPKGYRVFAGRSDGEIVALAGVGFGVNLYYRRYVWVYDLITTEKARSRGHGKALLDRLEELAKVQGCDTIALSSSFHRKDAHRFYEEKAGYKKTGYTFWKGLR